MPSAAQARRGKAPPPPPPASGSNKADRWGEHVAVLLVEAMDHVASGRLADVVHDLLPTAPPGYDERENTALLTHAMVMATELVLFAPSLSGATALDRLARARPSRTTEEAAVLAALRQSRLRLLRVEAPAAMGITRLRDVVSGEAVSVLDHGIGPEAAGVAVLGRLLFMDDGCPQFAGGVTPLDEPALAVARRFVRAGRPELMNPMRCAEAVFRHVLRHGVPTVPGLNELPPGVADDLPEDADELDVLAALWSEPGSVRDPEDLQFVRTEASLETVLAMLGSVAGTRAHGLAALSAGYAAIAQLQLETLVRRAAVGSGTVGLETVAAAVEAEIASGDLPPGTREAFAEVRLRLRVAAPAAEAQDGELGRLIGRIQALRAKTVAQGCTEAEALAAAAKVAELLDRYGLSLTELDLRAQSCEGASVETERRRAGPIDDCVPAVAAFFDCRVWGEKSPGGTLRYVFFGLPADVAGARYLYDLVDGAFASETARFRVGRDYAAMPSGMRRTATNSFQIGLARGIGAKLHTLRKTREGALRSVAGRDLVVAKADVIEEELAELGLQLRARSRSSRTRLLRKQFEQGQKAGLGFSYTPGLQHDKQDA